MNARSLSLSSCSSLGSQMALIEAFPYRPDVHHAAARVDDVLHAAHHDGLQPVATAARLDTLRGIAGDMDRIAVGAGAPVVALDVALVLLREVLEVDLPAPLHEPRLVLPLEALGCRATPRSRSAAGAARLRSTTRGRSAGAGSRRPGCAAGPARPRRTGRSRRVGRGARAAALAADRGPQADGQAWPRPGCRSTLAARARARYLTERSGASAERSAAPSEPLHR
jgi:hypothetical protein